MSLQIAGKLLRDYLGKATFDLCPVSFCQENASCSQVAKR